MSALQAHQYVLTNAGVRMPRLIYGTAWKKERTVDLVFTALSVGFRGIDTACQPKHYREDLVGQAIVKAIRKQGLSRSDLFIQTKFTSLDGQDPNNIPYDSKAALEDQVRQSFAKSLQNLSTDYVDSLVLHSPMRTLEQTLQVWRVFEEFYEEGKARQLGISNCYDFTLLTKLYDGVKVKPAVVQNRFYDRSGYDIDIRRFCKQKSIVYQSFWTLTANPILLQSNPIRQAAKDLQCTTEQAFFKFVMQLGIVPLTGTTDAQHMQQDLNVLELPDLPIHKLQAIAELIGENVMAEA